MSRKFEVCKFAFLLLVAIGAQPASSAIWQWSKTAGSNATADPTINWAEGMAPSAVNDSARSMMARLAEWRDDLSGLLGTGGIATAYTLSTNQGINATPNNGQELAFTPLVTNGVAATLEVDSGNIYPIQVSPGVAVAAGVLTAGAPIGVVFNSSANAWVLKYFYSVLGSIGTCNTPNSALQFSGGFACGTQFASLNTADQTVSGGANVTSFNLGTFSGAGTLTVDCGKAPLQYLVDAGAFTIAAPAADGSCMLMMANGTTAAAPSFSGFTVGASTGDPITTVNAAKFTISIWRINGIPSYFVKALQ